MSRRVFVLFYLTSICIRAAETSQVTFNRDSGGQRAADQFRDEVFVATSNVGVGYPDLAALRLTYRAQPFIRE